MPAASSSLSHTLQPVWRHLESGGTVLTSNTTAARFLLRHYAALQGEARAWLAPRVLPFSAWLHEEWTARLLGGSEDRMLLSTHQELRLWQKLLGPRQEFAPLAQEAWALLFTYAGGLAPLLALTRMQPSHREFAAWARTMETQLRRKRWITAAELPYTVKVSGSILLYGFDSVTPAQSAALSGAAVTHFAPKYPAGGNAVRASFPDIYTSIASAAAWAAARLDKNPAARLAVVAPNVPNVRGELSRALSRSVGVENFQFTLGLPLARQPIGEAGLALLEWMIRPLPLEAVTRLLLAPGLCVSTDTARYDVRMRRDFRYTLPELSLKQLLDDMQRTIERKPEEWTQLAEWHARARHAFFVAPPREATMLPSRWAAHFHRYLDAWQLASPDDASAAELQIERRWHELFDEFAQLDFDNEPMTQHVAVETLRHMAHSTIAAPASRDVAVDVIGPLESAGALFDGIFFLDASDAAWPTRGRAHPFLPAALQRRYEMPGASPAIDFAAMQIVTARLAVSAAECIFSWPRRDDEQPLHPSSLITQYDVAADTAVPTPPLDRAPSLAALEADDAPLVWQPERATLGAYTLKSQSACPFQAFAEFRLKAGPLECPDDGMDPRARGTVIHDILQSLWTSNIEPLGLKSHAALAAHIANNTLQQFIAGHVDKRLGGARSSFELAYAAIEKERLLALLDKWLRVEAERAPFHVVATEEKHSFPVAEVRFRLKLDRLDALDADGSLVLLDYKSGAKDSSKAWEANNMTDAQMPLYAEFALQDNPIPLAAVALAVVNDKNMSFDGVAVADDILPDVSGEDAHLNAEIRAGWHHAVTSLTEAFRDGVSTVTPRDPANTCRFCRRQGLCRIAAMTVEDSEVRDDA